jgi:aspartate racemase
MAVDNLAGDAAGGVEARGRVLGVLGGMGPLASAHFMLRLTQLTPAATEQDHVPAVLWSDPRVPDRTRGKMTGPDDPLPWLVRGLHGLQRAGCGAVAMPCNTAHGWYQEMQAACDLPILHIVDAAIEDLARLGIRSGRLGVMATAATLRMRLYQDRLAAHGWECIAPDEQQMQRAVSPAIAAVKENRLRDAYGPLTEVVNDLASRGAVAVVLGCTEIPIGIQAGPQEILRVPIVDTIDALARSSIAWAKGRDAGPVPEGAAPG